MAKKSILPDLSDRSRKPTGDLAHDTKYCRNGRIMVANTDLLARASSGPYTMAVYRQEGDGKNYMVVRNVYADRGQRPTVGRFRTGL